MKISKIDKKIDVDLRTLSTIKIGGVADIVYFPKDAEELQTVLQEVPNHKIIGRCSNILFPDGRFETPIISLLNFKNLDITDETIFAGSGYSLPFLAMQAEKYALSGLEWASHIPASLGGAIYMNAGAFGGTIGDVVSSVSYVEDGKVKNTCEYEHSYRHSEFMGSGRIILSASLKLKPSTIDEIKEKTKSFQKIRFDTQPYNKPSLGSIFKQNEGDPVWKLIDKAGLRGFSSGGASFSKKHCNFIVNDGGATAADVIKLVKLAKEKVYKTAKVKLQEEIEIW
ncbi:UDP-N-acetylmuramate dehydrogenase [Treponema sp. R6D11]